jgi:phage host-nuclease inhibitor protein Gam
MTSKKNTKTVSLKDAQTAGEQYTRANSALNKVEVEMNTKINELKARYTDRISEAKEEMAEAQEVLQTYANQEKKNWDKGSMDLLHCVIGFRKSPAKVVIDEGKTTWDKVTELAAKLFPSLVKKSTLVQLDKKAVVAASKDEKLFKKIQDKTGIDVVQDETFYVTAKTEELVS